MNSNNTRNSENHFVPRRNVFSMMYIIPVVSRFWSCFIEKVVCRCACRGNEKTIMSTHTIAFSLNSCRLKNKAKSYYMKKKN